MVDILIQSVPALMLIVVYLLLFAYPLYLVLKRTGMSRRLVVIAFVPYIGGFVLLWYIALARWPNVERETAAAHF